MGTTLKAALRITLIYALFAGLWIRFSDMALAASIDNVALLSYLQTLKGWAFVAVTAMLLFWVVLNSLRRVEELNQLDPLTGLLNHEMFKTQLEGRLLQRPLHQQLVVIYLDIDRFSELNQKLGFEQADELLSNFARELRDLYSATVLLGRFPPDQFAIAFYTDARQEPLERKITRLKQAFAKTALSHRQTITCSVGVAAGPEDGNSARKLMSAAAEALSRAKHDGGDGLAFFSRELSESKNRRRALLRDLRQALASNSLSLVYQPQYTLSTGALTGVEVLLRWQHPQQGLVSPDLFIGLAEENGLSDQISAFVISRAQQELQSQGLLAGVIPRVSINISAMEFNSPPLMNRLIEQIELAPLLRPWLQLEITETATLRDLEKSADIVRRLKARGIRFSIDDFGTGYTSLAMLKDLPIDEIKIDRCFINDLQAADGASINRKSNTIVTAILGMARNFGIHAVAEGIETEEQLQLLTDMGCREGQGFLLAVPMDIHRLRQHLSPTQSPATSDTEG